MAAISGDKFRCSIGKNGISNDKHEGDGKTPIGTFPIREIFIRSDKIPQAKLKNIKLPLITLHTYDGWCDDSKSVQYNKLVDLRHFDLQVSHEDLYRKDNLYDIIVVLGYNDQPVIPNKGSAIFVHVAAPNFTGTAGCIGFSESDLLQILSHVDRQSCVIVSG